ncbi:hypothetical protein ACOQFL_17030 [Actinopolyspora sp. H202]|uniref:hypothetical protein n=1 Tax=Actinopolyspora sp. H202 TaxID=1500456 RepID=UPI003EE4A028
MIPLKKIVVAMSYAALVDTVPPPATAVEKPVSAVSDSNFKMQVRNLGENERITIIENVRCVYDNGDQGSHPDLFNNHKFAPGDRLPSWGGQHIERDNSGDCFYGSSRFTLRLVGFGQVKHRGTDKGWKITDNTNPDKINIEMTTSNSGQQHIIVRML